MIQLGYYSTNQQPTPDESIDFDPNYDPSDFLIKKDSTVEPEIIEEHQQQQQYEEPQFEFPTNNQEGIVSDDLQQQQNFYGSFSQQSFNVNDFGFQQPQQMLQDDYSQSQTQPMMTTNDGGGLADLEISDSDDEDEPNDEEMIPVQNTVPDTSKDDDDGLWF